MSQCHIPRQGHGVRHDTISLVWVDDLAAYSIMLLVTRIPVGNTQGVMLQFVTYCGKVTVCITTQSAEWMTLPPVACGYLMCLTVQQVWLCCLIWRMTQCPRPRQYHSVHRDTISVVLSGWPFYHLQRAAILDSTVAAILRLIVFFTIESLV